MRQWLIRQEVQKDLRVLRKTINLKDSYAHSSKSSGNNTLLLHNLVIGQRKRVTSLLSSVSAFNSSQIHDQSESQVGVESRS